jgi:hypothetical protein
MGLELEQAKKVSGTLQRTVQILSKTSINNESDRVTFKQRMDDLFDKSESDFNTVNERISATETQLKNLVSELQHSNCLYKDILIKEEAQLNALAGLTSPPSQPETLGFFSNFNFFKRPVDLMGASTIPNIAKNFPVTITNIQ